MEVQVREYQNALVCIASARGICRSGYTDQAGVEEEEHDLLELMSKVHRYNQYESLSDGDFRFQSSDVHVYLGRRHGECSRCLVLWFYSCFSF